MSKRRTKSKGGAWHNHIPAWIVSDAAYATLRQGPRQTLQTIADRCDAPKGRDDAPLLVCFGGDDLVMQCGCDRSTFWRHLSQLERCGFVVCLSGGRFRIANVYGIPGERGQLDTFRAESIQPRGAGKRGPTMKPRGTGNGGCWTTEDSDRIRLSLSQSATLAASDADRDTTSIELRCQPSEIATSDASKRDTTIPSPSLNHTHQPSAAAVVAAMRKEGIGKARAESLATEIPTLTVGAVRSLAKRTKTQAARRTIKQPGAYLAKLIEDEGEAESAQLVAKSERQADADARMRHEEEERAAELRESYERQREEIDAYVGRMNEKELKRAFRRANLPGSPTPAHVRSDAGWCERLRIYQYRPKGGS